MKNTVLVTGASSGIGLATARLLAARALPDGLRDRLLRKVLLSNAAFGSNPANRD